MNVPDFPKNVLGHYQRLAFVTTRRVEEMRENNDHFSLIDDELTYLRFLNQKLKTLESQ